MIENSLIGDKKVAKSMSKLNHASSDKKFRVKSLRMRTQQKHPKSQLSGKTQFQFPSVLKSQQLRSKRQFSPIKHQKVNLKDVQQLILSNKLRVKSSILLQKDYERQIQKRFSIPRIIVQQIFRLKLQYDQMKFSEQKYLQFCKNFYLRVVDKIEISVEKFNLKGRALQKFLQFYLNWRQKHIIGLDLSLCSQVASIAAKRGVKQNQLLTTSSGKKILTQPNQQQTVWPMNSILLRLIQTDHRLTKLSLRNLHLTPYQMTEIFSQMLKSSRIYSLDISNITSQTINRLGTYFQYLQMFFTNNQTLAIIKMDNLSIGDDCIQKMVSGMLRNSHPSVIKILSLSNNFVTYKSVNSIYNMVTKVGLTQLNLSNNPLGPEFYLLLKNLRANSIKHLDLSSTNMNSQSLIHLLAQLVENKNIQTLILDNNDFSHHWFNKIDDIFLSGISLQQLSLINCGIKNFDQLFEGIQHSRYLSKLNLNYNVVTIQTQDVSKVINCFKINKILKSLKMRFCGYNQPILIRLLDALKDNKTLQLLDISENHLSDNGAKYILKLLNQNSVIAEIGIEKLQLTVKMIQQITQLIEHNQSKRQKKQHITLIDQNKMYKQRDTHSWTDIHQLQSLSRKIQNQVADAKSRNQQLQLQVTQKRQNILQTKKTNKLQAIKLDKDLKKQQQQIQSKLRNLNQQIQKITQIELKSLQNLQIEKNLIKSLQSKIQKENQKIKRRQDQLQQKFRDQKYLQRKKEKLQKQSTILKQQSQQASKKGSGQLFENTKGFKSLTKRKSTTVHKKV